MRLPQTLLRLVTGTLLVGGVVIGSAQAQIDSREGLMLRNQIEQLRHDVQTLQDQVANRGGSSLGSRTLTYAPPAQGNDLLAQLLTRVDALEDQVRQLRGRVDELQNQTQRQNADLGKRIDDLAFQMQPPGGVQAGQPATPGAGTPPPTAPRPPPVPVKRTPEMAMQEGNAALARRDYPAAEQAAREVIAAKGAPRVYDGQLLLAQALFGARKYDEAALTFDDTYKASRKGAHAQDALLGLSNAFLAIKQKEAACQTLAKLRTEFPQPRGDLKDAIASARQRGGCP